MTRRFVLWVFLATCFTTANVRAADPPTNTEQPVNAVPENIATHPITITGQAKDAAGKPVSGATIYVASHEAFHKLLKTTKTDKNGNYAFHDLKLPIATSDGSMKIESGRFEIYGTADGYAFTWRAQKHYYVDLRGNSFATDRSPDLPSRFEGDEKINLDLVFHRPAKLSGTIVDDLGNPIPKAKVHLFNCWRAPTDKFDDSDMFQVDMSSLYSKDYCPPEISTVRTNEHGEFRFLNAPPECRFRVSLRPPKFSTRMMYATTESDPNATRKGKVLERDGMKLVFLSPRKIRIQLVGLADPKHGDGAFVNPHGKLGSDTDISDKDGVANLEVPVGKYKVSILPPVGTPYWKTDTTITVTDDPSQTFELKMTPAAVVDIQAIDESGRPVKDAAGFDLWVKADNGQRDIHYFRNYERATNTAHVHRVRTDKNGKMRAVFLPGKHLIGIGSESVPDGWRVIDNGGKEVELKVGEPTKVQFRVRAPDNGDF